MPNITWHHSSWFIIPELPSGSNIKGFKQEISKYRALPGSIEQDGRKKGRNTYIAGNIEIQSGKKGPGCMTVKAFCLVYYGSQSHSSFFTPLHMKSNEEEVVIHRDLRVCAGKFFKATIKFVHMISY